MRLHIISVGRWSAGPERALYEFYADRVDKAGKSIGIGPLSLKELTFKKQVQQQDEARALLDAAPKQTALIALDENGKQETSETLARFIGHQRDDGIADLAFLIGGADGHHPSLLRQSHRTISLGRLTWPHLLVRGLLAEQLYRAVTILSGHPYHRS